MRVTIDPEHTRTMVPIVIEVSETDIQPTISVEPIGQLAVKKINGQYLADFYVQTPGEYKVQVRSGDDQFVKMVSIEQQEYLKFGREFGIFTVLFFIVMTGVVIWTRKIMKPKQISNE